MRYTIEFADGDISNNIIDALHYCSAEQIGAMIRDGAIRMNQKQTSILPSSLLPDHLDRYSAESGVPMLNLLFGPDASASTTYTPYDNYVRSSLESFSERGLRELCDQVDKFFPNELFKTTGRPSYKLHAVLTSFSTGTLIDAMESDDHIPDYKQLRHDIRPEIDRYYRSHRSPKFVFLSDYLPDLATYAGVSLHWILSLDSPLYFSSQMADVIFDRYTLMSESEQRAFCHILKKIQENRTLPFPF